MEPSDAEIEDEIIPPSKVVVFFGFFFLSLDKKPIVFCVCWCNVV